MSLVNADDISNDQSISAARKGIDLGFAWPRQESPSRVGFLPRPAVIDVSSFCIDHLFSLAPRTAVKFLGQLRGFGHALLINFSLTGRVDVREIEGRKLAQCGYCSRHPTSCRCHRNTNTAGGCTRRSKRTGAGSRCTRWAEIPGATGIPTQAAAGEAEPPIDFVLKEVRPHKPVGRQTTLRVSDQPESLDIFLADLPNHKIYDVLQVLIVGLGPYLRRGGRSSNHQAVLILVINERKIVSLPVPV